MNIMDFKLDFIIHAHIHTYIHAQLVKTVKLQIILSLINQMSQITE